MSFSSGPFPPEALALIQEIEGNQKCCDCSSIDTDWASVSHGTLICLDCAGKHRSLGVHCSFVRSIHMDSWTEQQVEMMRQGGNEQIRDFFRKLQIENTPIENLYRSKAAAHYRERLKERAEQVIAGIIKPNRSHRSPHPDDGNHSRVVNTSQLSINETKGKSKALDPLEYLDFAFPDGPMGMTITKDKNDSALVSRLVPGGLANTLGILIGDVIVGVAGKNLRIYEEVMHMIPYMPRPLKIRIERVKHIKSMSPSSSSPSHLPSPSPPVIPAATAAWTGVQREASPPAYRFMALSDPLALAGSVPSKCLPLPVPTPMSNAIQGNPHHYHHPVPTPPGLSPDHLSKPPSLPAPPFPPSHMSVSMPSEESRPKGKAKAKVREQKARVKAKGERVSVAATGEGEAETTPPRTIKVKKPSSKSKPKSMAAEEGMSRKDVQSLQSVAVASETVVAASEVSGRSGRDREGTAAEESAVSKDSVQVQKSACEADAAEEVIEDRPTGPHSNESTSTPTETPEIISNAHSATTISAFASNGVAKDVDIAGEECGKGEEDDVDEYIECLLNSERVDEKLSQHRSNQEQPSPETNKDKSDDTVTEASSVIPEVVEDGTVGMTEGNSTSVDIQNRLKEAVTSETAAHGAEVEAVTESDSSSVGAAAEAVGAGPALGAEESLRESNGARELKEDVELTEDKDGEATVEEQGIADEDDHGDDDYDDEEDDEQEYGEEEEEEEEEEDETGEDESEGEDDSEDEEGGQTTSQSAPQMRNCTHFDVLEAGTIVQVYRFEETQWITAMVLKRHKDGRYKVTYRDKQSESHVDPSRIAIRIDYNSFGGSPSTQRNPHDEGQTAHQALEQSSNNRNGSHQSNPYGITQSHRLEDAADFVVTSNDDNLEDWIENEEPVIVTLPKVNSPPALTPRTRASIASATSASGYISLDDNGGTPNGSDAQHSLSPEGSGTGPSQITSDMKLTFEEPPLGLTLTKGYGGRAEVTKVVPGGAAELQGVLLGDVVIGINGQWMQGYDEVMAEISLRNYPMSVVVRRGLLEEIQGRKPGIVAETKVLAEKMLSQLGLKMKSKGILQTPTPARLSTWKKGSQQDDAFKSPSTASASMTTRVALGHPTDLREFDVMFIEGDLGLRLEERHGSPPVSVVVSIQDDGQALRKGITVGCVVLGINGEKYISHAHTVSTLKHGKRPMVVRFLRS